MTSDSESLSNKTVAIVGGGLVSNLFKFSKENKYTLIS